MLRNSGLCELPLPWIDTTTATFTLSEFILGAFQRGSFIIHFQRWGCWSMGKIRLHCSRSVTVEINKLNCRLEVAGVIYTWGTGGWWEDLWLEVPLPNLLTWVQSSVQTDGKMQISLLKFIWAPWHTQRQTDTQTPYTERQRHLGGGENNSVQLVLYNF